MNGNKTTYVIGHRTPDADSVCSAIGLARLRGCTPARAGSINRETEYILKTFGVEVPVLLENVSGCSLILVDHNKRHHAAEGIERAEILEITDHHFFGSSEDLTAHVVRNEILGSTAAIISKMYEEEGAVPDAGTAGILLGAIISDTLFFKSPNSTETDRQEAVKLAELAGIDLEDFAMKVLRAASDFSGRSISEIFYQDYKVFRGEGISFGCGALSLSVGTDDTELEEKIIKFMEQEQEKKDAGPDFMLFMLTDLSGENTLILCGGDHAAQVVSDAYKDFGKVRWTGKSTLRAEGILSRKTQLVPQVTKAAEELRRKFSRV